MNYLYMTCKDCSEEAIKEEIFKRYGLKICNDSLYDANSKQKIFFDNLDEAKQAVKTESATKQAYERLMNLSEGKDTKRIRLKTVINELETLVADYCNYEDDLAADSLMGLLWTDDNYEVRFEQEVQNLEDKNVLFRTRKLEYLWEKCKDHVVAQKNYPYASMRKYPQEHIPGGCVEFHKVMMNPEHIITFDFPKKVQSSTNVGKYTFPKMDAIYQKLQDSSIENILLLERTVGTGTANLFYSKFKDIKQTDDLEKIAVFIEKCMDIEPIFIRKAVINILGDYLMDAKGIVDELIPIVEDLLDVTIFVIGKLYNAMFEYIWGLYYLAYRDSDNENNDILLLLRGRAYQGWFRYYEDWNIYQEFLEEYKMYDWRAKKRVEEFFAEIKEEDAGRLTFIEKLSAVNIKCANGKVASFYARKPIKRMGEKIRDRAEKELAQELAAPLPIEDMRKLLYEKEEAVFKDIWDAEKERFNNMSYSYPKSKTTKITMYAYIQIQVIQKIQAAKSMGRR